MNRRSTMKPAAPAGRKRKETHVVLAARVVLMGQLWLVC
jgi:hypothetical protein